MDKDFSEVICIHSRGSFLRFYDFSASFHDSNGNIHIGVRCRRVTSSVVPSSAV